MTDNVNVLPSDNTSAVSVATDDIGGVHFPVYKLSYGADGSVTLVDVTNRLPVISVAVDPNDETRKGEFDNLFSIPVTVDVAHHEIHEGDTYSMMSSDDVAASGHEVQLYIKTPTVASPQKRMHLILNHMGSGAHFLSGVEGITYSAGGADVTPTNHFRQTVPKVSSTQAAKVGSDKDSNVITYTGGTPLWPAMYMGSGKTSGGEARGVNEWVLAPNTEYIFAIESGATSTSISIGATWYEHSDG